MENTLKTALILYGFCRTFEFCKSSLDKHLLTPLDCDVFISSPNTFYIKQQDEVKEFRHIYPPNENNINKSIIDFFGNRLKAFEAREYNSQKYINILNNNNLPLFNQLTNQHTWRNLSYFDNMNYSVSLFNKYINDNNLHYDAVILTRPDLKYYSDFNLNVVDFNKINYPSFHYPPANEKANLSRFDILNDDEEEMKNTKRVEGGAQVFGFNRTLNDQILISTQKNILIYNNIFNKSIEYYKRGICFNQETCLGAHCLFNGLDFTGTDFISYRIWRKEK